MISLIKHFQAKLSGLPLVVFGQESVPTDSDMVQLMIEGPDYLELGKGNYKISFYVQIVLGVKQVPDDVYKYIRIEGQVAAAMTDICVNKYGTNPEDTQEFLGTLKQKGEVNVQRLFGFSPAAQVNSGTVKAQYEIQLKE